MAYKGTSIVDYLKSVGQSSSYSDRAKLAQQKGIQGYRGTAQQNLQLLEQLRAPAQETGLSEVKQSLKSIQEQVPTITADVKALKSTSDIDITPAPPVDIDTGDAVATGNGLSAQFTAQLEDSQKAYEKLLKEQEERAKVAETKQQTYLDKLTGLVKKREDTPAIDTEDIYKKALEEYGLTPEKMQEVQGLIGQSTSYLNQIADLENRKQASLDRIEGRPGIGLEFMNREQQEISRKYNREISLKSAQAGIINQQIQLQRGLFDDARATAGQIVNAATYDQQQKVADMDWAIDTYADLFNIMDTEEKEAWNTAYTIQKEELDRQQTDMTNKLNLLVTAGENGIDLKWDMNYMKDKTLGELTSEYSSKIAGRPAEAVSYAPPTSHKEWELAGGLQGTGKTYAEWLKKEEDIKWTKDKIGDYIQGRISQGEGWATIENELKNQGVPTYTGSTVDKLLNSMLGETDDEVEALDLLINKHTRN